MVDKRDEADKLIDELIAGKTPDEIVGHCDLLGFSSHCFRIGHGGCVY